jgi:NIMA (never in mitosis gene a)-related kinase|mmetsp:Transcript_89962/g.140908  ORF Transcript_89962/g.140908 Transcript_89962/m.140908 type:complete len:341 (+) Transcript_89962:114-1136(+)
MVANCGGYTKIREIGSGSFGKAILVKDSESRQYVLKAIDISRMDSKERRDAVNEVRVLSSLKHPYVVSYRESFLDGRTLCIVMDYAEGGDLYNRISKQRKVGQNFPEPQIVRWFTQGSLALKHLHERHVLHRDLKSQNLFLTGSGRLRIGDFGIAKVLDSTAAFAKTTIGTPYYLSPEICQERPYSWSSDVWAMGCILYEMAALRVPFDAPNIRALVTKITRGPMPVVPPRYSAEFQRLCWDLLQREERKRPSSTDVLRYPIIQTEIRNMLKEEQDKKNGPGDRRSPPLSAREARESTPQRRRTPLGGCPDLPVRLPSANIHARAENVEGPQEPLLPPAA